MPKGNKRQPSAARENRRFRRESRRLGYETEDAGQIFRQEPRRSPSPSFKAKTQAQGQYAADIDKRDIIFGIGPAGTGKTYVAASLAAQALYNNDIKTLVLSRPMVSCDEEFGFLPGDESEKYAPWIEPIIDVLEEQLGSSQVKALFKSGRIVAKPLMLMRGKSYRDTWVILDEAQNVTPNQMKMFLTRIGEGSKFIIDGDMRQSDLKDKRGVAVVNGLEDAVRRLANHPQIGVNTFTNDDIVRHGLVRDILESYGE